MNEVTRKTFFYEMSLVGDALLSVTDAVRINYEMLGNLEPALHAHIFPPVSYTHLTLPTSDLV